MKIIMMILVALFPIQLEENNWYKETTISIVVPYDEIEVQYIPLSLISQ